MLYPFKNTNKIDVYRIKFIIVMQGIIHMGSNIFMNESLKS